MKKSNEAIKLEFTGFFPTSNSEQYCRSLLSKILTRHKNCGSLKAKVRSFRGSGYRTEIEAPNVNLSVITNSKYLLEGFETASLNLLDSLTRESNLN
jgi:hypothetical protein